MHAYPLTAPVSGSQVRCYLFIHSEKCNFPEEWIFPSYIQGQWMEVPWWHSGLRIQPRPCYGLDCCRGSDSSPGLETSVCHRHRQTNKPMRTRRTEVVDGGKNYFKSINSKNKSWLVMGIFRLMYIEKSDGPFLPLTQKTLLECKNISNSIIEKILPSLCPC